MTQAPMISRVSSGSPRTRWPGRMEVTGMILEFHAKTDAKIVKIEVQVLYARDLHVFILSA